MKKVRFYLFLLVVLCTQSTNLLAQGFGGAMAMADHAIFVGHVEHLDLNEAEPLIYHGGDYVGRSVRVEARVAEVCQKKGCFFIAQEAKQSLVRAQTIPLSIEVQN